MPKKMSTLRAGNVLLDKTDDIEQHVLRYYLDLFATDNNCIANGLVDSVVPSIVSAKDNIVLSNLLSREEVKNVVFSMNGNGARVLMGLVADFIRNIGILFRRMCLILLPSFSCKVGSFLLNSNLVVLVPKFPEADSI